MGGIQGGGNGVDAGREVRVGHGPHEVEVAETIRRVRGQRAAQGGRTGLGTAVRQGVDDRAQGLGEGEAAAVPYRLVDDLDGYVRQPWHGDLGGVQVVAGLPAALGPGPVQPRPAVRAVRGDDPVRARAEQLRLVQHGPGESGGDGPPQGPALGRVGRALADAYLQVPGDVAGHGPVRARHGAGRGRVALGRHADLGRRHAEALRESLREPRQVQPADDEEPVPGPGPASYALPLHVRTRRPARASPTPRAARRRPRPPSPSPAGRPSWDRGH